MWLYIDISSHKWRVILCIKRPGDPHVCYLVSHHIDVQVGPLLLRAIFVTGSKVHNGEQRRQSN